MSDGGEPQSPYDESIRLLQSDPERYFRENPTPVFGYPEPEPRRRWWTRRGSR